MHPRSQQPAGAGVGVLAGMPMEEISLIHFRPAVYLGDHEEPSSAVAITVHTHKSDTDKREAFQTLLCE